MVTEDDLGHWYYAGDPFDPDNNFGFVYLISCTHPEEPRKYIGKKQFHVYSKNKRVKGSNWRTYSSSSKHINDMISKYGKEYFTFEILQIFETRGGLSAGEVKVQWHLDVLTEKFEDGSPVYMNRQIGAIKFIPKEAVTVETKVRLDEIHGDREREPEGNTEAEEAIEAPAKKASKPKAKTK